LRDATWALHERVDHALVSLDLADRLDYIGFLTVQFAARGPIEAWIARGLSQFEPPPPQTGLIAADLHALGAATPADITEHFDCDPAGGLGVAWALGGSSLGNRAMLADLRKRGAAMPTTFLGDPAMPAYFARLRARLELPADDAETAEASIAGARAVFAAFLRAAARADMKRAA